MSDIKDPTSWTDREREFFALGWNECLKMQPGENGRLRTALIAARDFVNTYGPDTPGEPARRTNDTLAVIDATLHNQQSMTEPK